MLLLYIVKIVSFQFLKVKYDMCITLYKTKSNKFY